MLFIENDKKYTTPISSRVLDFCDAPALTLILSNVFYFLKQVALSFIGTSCRMITAHTTVNTGLAVTVELESIEYRLETEAAILRLNVY